MIMALELTFKSQNVNSMSLSQGSLDSFNHKMISLINNSEDIIFLQDLRLNLDVKPHHATLIKNILYNNAFGTYDAFLNSKIASRGTGIFIKKSAEIVVHERHDDIKHNYILLIVEKGGQRMLLGSVYGPNKDNERGISWYKKFFDKIKYLMENNRNLKICLGGDWNTIICNLDQNNPDLIGSNIISQKRNQVILLEFMEKLKLFDPYRLIYPNKKAFSWQNYSKKGPKKRLDFFLCSEHFGNRIKSCGISTGTVSSKFDHCCIKLDIGKNM